MQFQATNTKITNYNISEIINQIKLKFEDLNVTMIYSLWVVYYYLEQIQHGWYAPS